MTKIIAPKIPKGNSNKIYVLSDTSAKEFLKESQDIIKKHWPFTEKDSIAESKTKKAYLRLEPSTNLTVPSINRLKQLVKYSVKLMMIYEEKTKDNFKNKLDKKVKPITIPKNFLDFAYQPSIYMKSIGPIEFEAGSNVFVYNIFKPSGINLLRSIHTNFLLTESDEKHLNDLLVPEFQKISDELKDSLEKRSAIITRHYFDTFYTM